MARRRIRRILWLVGIVGSVKIGREMLVARNRKRAPEIIGEHPGGPPLSP